MTNPRRPPLRCSARGFILLPVTLALTLVASVAYLASRDSAINVAMVANRTDSERARYAAEAGLQHANYLLQQTGCAGSYPQAGATALVNNSFAGASYTAFADRASGSPVTLSATGRYNGAAVTLSRTGVIVYQPALQTFTIQPDTTSGKDTYLSVANPTTNYGAESTLRLSTNAYQPLLRFDFAILPPASRPVAVFDAALGKLTPGAQLSLYQPVAVSGGWSVDAQLITRSWVAGNAPAGSTPGASWTTYDGSNAWPAPGRGYAAPPLASQPNSNSGGWQHWDLTDAAAAWLSGVVPNHGVWLVDRKEPIADLRYVSSNQSVNLTQRPKLALNYLLPCGSSAPQRVTLTATRDTEIDSSIPNADKGTASRMSVSATREQRVLVAFDTSAITPGSTIGSAILRLYLDGASPIAASTALTLSINAMITQSWTAEASWNERHGDSGSGSKAWDPAKGGTFRATAAATTTLPQGFPEGNWIEFEVGPLVQEWVSGVTPNLGVILRNSTAVADELRFITRNAETARAPQLVVTYR